MSLIGKKAPDFNAKAVIKGEIIDNFKLSDHQGKYVVLFFYPLDFTFVCPTELHAFQEKLGEFEQRNTQVIAVSTDSHFSHAAWLNTPKNQGGIEGVSYPIVSDFNKTISRDFDVLLEEDGVALRGGHHCTQPLMRKLGVESTSRASFYFYNTTDEIDRFVEVIRDIQKFFNS